MAVAPIETARRWVFRFAGTSVLLLAGGVLFAASFPNPVVRFGIWPIAFVALVPVVVAIRRMPLWATPLYGAFYGFAAYALVNYWLANFHPLAIFIVPVIYATYFFFLFPALKLADLWFPRAAIVVQPVLWIAYEFLRTKGFLGYAYGIMGYTLYKTPILIQIADIAGVWIVSAIVIFPSFIIGRYLLGSRRWTRASAVGWGAAMFLSLVYGAVAPVDLSSARTWRVALVQQNIDPWRGGQRAYRLSLDALIRQSERALEDHPEIVIWSETSFVPAIDYHTRYRGSPERYELVRELLEYLADKPVPFVIGNSDGQLVRNADGDLDRVDYNAVLLFERDQLVETYRKTHLVPFTEHFPYRRAFPWLYDLLVANDTTFWEKGTEYTVFDAAGVRFSTPICFEDTFGYLSREFVRNGAEVIVNMTNDLWSFSESSALQHMGMAVFRAVENRRSVVRSTNGGMTAIIDPNGTIQEVYPPFVEGYLVGTVPVFTERSTVYTRFGDWLGAGSVVTAVVILGIAAGARLYRRLTKRERA